MEYCKQTGKVSYESQYAADLIIHGKKKKRQSNKYCKNKKKMRNDIKEVASYQCPFCKMWHLAGR